MSSVIKTEGLSKKYRLRRQRYDNETLRDLIGNALTRALFMRSSGSHIDDLWALRDIDLEIRQGDTIGLVGRNGAGKSTLLKVLSRITKPTSGRAIVTGTVSSLLEIGTGFHMDLTGRENIFLNGAIHGVKRAEMLKRFDEILAFSEIEEFIDTPVKFYSSGMHARLAFSVAAHVRSDILIVDEVLAVGDASFQNKCLSHMKAIAESGRTIVFVSHDAASIRRLCKSAVYLENGSIKAMGPTDNVLDHYYRDLELSLPE